MSDAYGTSLAVSEEARPFEKRGAITGNVAAQEEIVKLPFNRESDRIVALDIGSRLVKVLTWFDNEWGYASRFADMVATKLML